MDTIITSTKNCSTDSSNSGVRGNGAATESAAQGSIRKRSLIQQVDQVARRTTNQVFHGPDTVEHFEAFSIDSVMSELRAGMPDIYCLFATLGKTERNRAADQEGRTPEGDEGFDIGLHPIKCSL